MDLVRWAGFGLLALAGLALAIFILDGFWPMFLGASVSLAISGILLLAVDKALQLLSEIRDALKPQAMHVQIQAMSDTDLTATTPVKTMAELNADLVRAKAKL